MNRIAKILTNRTFQVLLVILYLLLIIRFFNDSVKKINHLWSYRTVLIFLLLGFQVNNTQFSTKNSTKLVKTMTDEETEIVESLINVGEQAYR